MFQTLNSKLIAALLLLLGLTSIGYVVLTITTTNLYFHEANQKLNKDVAAHIVGEASLLENGVVNQDELKSLFHTLMVVNPSIELYLVDVEGNILGFDAPRGRVMRERISMQPLRSFLANGADGADGAEFPILGTDPRSTDRSKPFSAAPVMRDGVTEGYLYIVLGGEAFDSVTEMIGDSYILTLAVVVAAISLVLSLMVGFLSFNWLTRRLRRLDAGVAQFRRSDLQHPLKLDNWRRDDVGDEIDRLGQSVEQMSARIVDQFRQLRDADTMRREMLTNISHDLRTPLTSLHGYLETLQMKAGELSAEDRASYLDLAAKHAKSVGKLVAQILELATLESGGVQSSPEPFSMSELAHDVAQKFAPKMAAKNIVLETTIPEGTPYVSGDIALIERVLDNLIENAIKYTEPNGTIQLSLRAGDTAIAAEVIDTGIGIEADDIPQIFDRFYRGKQRHDGEQAEGTGLGLAIAKRILQLHDQTITVDSKPGAGSRFAFELPLVA